MAVISSPRTSPLPPAARQLALAVADANWYTTENLFHELHSARVATLLLKCIDYYNAWRRGAPPWQWGRTLTRCGPNLWQRELVLPSGWMKRFPSVGMRPIGRSIAAWRSHTAPGGRLALVMTYPHYLYLRDQVRPDIHVYFNVDDYSQYWPRCARALNDLEQRAVRESDLTVCVSRQRAEELRAAVPQAADRIRHLPHGAPSRALGAGPQTEPAEPPADLAHLPRPLLGYVGSLEDRIDWGLLTRLSEAFPSASIVLIGRLAAARSLPWYLDMRRCLARPNVHALGFRAQESIDRYNRSFDVCLIPYGIDHPFNRVCCPTKIMDYMATGRPIVSTALPECVLYSHLFDVAGSIPEFLSAVDAILTGGSNDGRAAVRYDWACAHSCQRVAERFLDWLPLDG
jgi:glycosyltransferase involved in cell wall biosynthesis